MTWQELAKTHEHIPYSVIDKGHYLAVMPWALAGLMILGAVAGFYISRWADR